MRLKREEFIFTVSVFFTSMSLVQLVALSALGVMTQGLAFLGLLALLPLIAAMPIGEWIGRRLSPQAFDIAIMTFLGILAVRLIWAEFW